MAGIGVGALVGPARLLAQIEGDRGIAPVIDTGDLEVDNIDVVATGRTAQDARLAGWHNAYRQAWARLNGPALGDDALESVVSSVVIGHEQLGPHRYIARLGVIFDRGRAGALLSGNTAGVTSRSAPTLVIPVLYAGGVGQVYEIQGAWQRVWAEFNTGASAIDYVRPSGAGGESLILTAGQPGRRSRVWWRNILDQFGASNVVMAMARLERQWPGGPVTGTFTARYGPDNTWLDSFTLTAPDDDAIPAMLQEALHRFDTIFTHAYATGVLEPDATLSIDHPDVDPALAGLIAEGQRQRALEEQQLEAQAQSGTDLPIDAANPANPVPAESAPPPSGERPAATAERPAHAAAFTVQFASPDAAAVDGALDAVRALPRVASAATTSLAIGGTSVMRVSYGGSAQDLAVLLRQRGWQVAVAGNVLRIRR
ncbi:MAG: heavy-metal-associated domain-containing protein [Sphingomonadales bacterium]|nr:heavy-metal-associated domain-containing protein [Sphingomonadales bacterium]